MTGKGKLKLSGVAITTVQEGLRTKILKTISNPNIAYILFMIGLAGLYFELAHPGAIFPGVVGGIALILAFFFLSGLAGQHCRTVAHLAGGGFIYTGN